MSTKQDNYFVYPKNKQEYDQKVKLMEILLERDYPDDHPLFVLIDILGNIIDRYETEHFPEVRQLEKNASNY